MTHSRRAGYSVVGILILAACDSACAVDPLGFYMGAGVGRSHVRSDLNLSAFGPLPSRGFSTVGTKTGWKAILGLRPLSIIGAEAEFIDFGSASGSASIPATVSTGGLNATVSSHPKGGALVATGQSPITLA